MLQRKQLCTTTITIFTCLCLAGCGSRSNSSQSPAVSEQTKEQSQPLVIDLEPDSSSPGQPAASGEAVSAETTVSGQSAASQYKKGSPIPSQTFDLTIHPLGPVTFASYEPDASENPLSDVVFLIEKDGQTLTQLPGTTENNIGSEVFDQVEAISFPDYNHDNYDDIIIILSYHPQTGSGPAASHSVIRYYKGTPDGRFLYERQMSQDATSALDEITIRTAKDFISGGSTAKSLPEQDVPEADASLKPWQQAYIQYLTIESDPQAQQGYTLISMSDDNIPQLAEIGIDEATGSRIIHYAGGKVHVTQLNRLSFSYIPGSNLLCNSEGLMDYYYDLVYQLTDGEMKLIASGYYGAADNSNVQFDNEGNPVYQYQWNEVPMSEEEYNQALSQVYDASKAKTYSYDNLYSRDEIIRIIKEYTS